MSAAPGVLVAHPAGLEHDPGAFLPGHPEAPDRLRAIERRLAAAELRWERLEAPRATEAQLLLVHEAAHVERVRALAAAGGGPLDADTFVGERSYDAALRAAGGACELARLLLCGEARTGFSAMRPPGHHAEPGRAMGFCLFGNVAVAAAHAIADLGARRVFVLDWDVHHGNGTEAVFARRSDVLYASLHQEGIYPGTGRREDRGAGDGRGFSINAPLAAGSGEEQWLAALEEDVLPAAARFAPDLILISAGFDAHRADPLAGCLLESGSFGLMAAHVRELADQVGAPVGAVLEGGYEPEALADSVLATMAELGREPPR